MSNGYKELIKGNPGETEIRSFLVNGDQVSVTLRIPDTLRDAAKEEAALRGMSFSAFVRTCMIEELAKKGQKPVTEPMHDISVEGFIESFDRRYPTFILKTLLCDRTTGRNIIWADNEYEALGDGYMGDDEMTVEKITGMNSGVIKPRIAKEQEKQSQRTKSRAEVFTPSWLCNQMNNDLDEAWFGRRDVFNTEIVADDGANTWTPTSDPIEFPKSKGHGWRAYVEATRLEITCGEAPFVCSRYDTVTGDELPVSERVGFLDRKLRVVTEKTKTRKEWVRRALDALRATYGFEYQGDNLLIARVNVLETFVEHLRNRWGSGPQQDELEQAAWIVSWNFWQMNGFTDAVPTNKMGAEVESTLGTFEEPEPEPMQPSLFDLFDDVFPDETTEETKEEEPRETVPLCVIYDWQNGEPFEFAALKGEAAIMGKKFYAVIGNPHISFQWRNKILAIRPMHRPSITSLWTRRSRFPTRWSLSLPLDSYLTPAQPQRPGTGRCLTTPISK